MSEPLGITLNDSSLAATWGLKVEGLMEKIGDKVFSAISQGLLAAKDLVNKMAAGAAALIESIQKGNFLSLIKSWIKDNPTAAVAGGVALVLTGGVIIAAVGSGIAAIAGAIAGAGFLTKAAILAVAIPFAIQAAQKIDNFDWQKTDSAIEDELRSRLAGLYGIAGEAIGRSMAGLLIGKGQRAPVQINMRATATFFLILEEQNKTDIQEEILESLAQLAWAAARYAGQVVFAKSYIQVRKWARQNIRTGIESIDKTIANWGLEENRSWSIASAREKAVEEVKEADENLGEFLENFLEGFGEGLSEFLVMEYSR